MEMQTLPFAGAWQDRSAAEWMTGDTGVAVSGKGLIFCRLSLGKRGGRLYKPTMKIFTLRTSSSISVLGLQ